MSLVWQESVPSNASPVGQFPTYARNIWQTIAAGMAVEHYWPGAGITSSDSSMGDLLPGGSRCFVGPKSQSSLPSTATIGRLYLCSDTSQLLIYDSNATWVVGTPNYDEYITTAVAASTYWARVSMTTLLAVGNSTVTITYGAGGTFFQKFNSTPLAVYQTVSDGSWIVGVYSLDEAKCVSYYSSLLNASGTPTLYVEALGQVSSISF